MLVSDRLVVHIRLLAVLRRYYSVLSVKIIEDTGKECQRSCEVYREIQKLLYRTVQPVDKSYRRSNDTDRKIRVDVLYDEISAGKIYEKRSDLGEHSHYDPEELARSLLLEVEVRHLPVDFDKVVIFLLLAGEYLDQHRAADRQRLVDLLIEFIALGLALREILPSRAACSPRRKNEKRYDQYAHYRKMRAHAEQCNESRDYRRDITDNVRESAADDRADTAYVGVHPRDDVALLLGREEGMRHVLEMFIHLIAHVEDYLLGYPRIDVVLKHTDQLAYSERSKSHKEQPDKQLHVLSYKCLINDTAGYDRRQQSHSCRQQYRDEYEDELQPVRLEIAQYPDKQRLRHFGHVLFFLIGEESHRAAHTSRTRSRHYIPPFT